MFASYKKHNNQLYNNLVKLSRNKFFYENVKIKDRIESRVLLIFFHFALLLSSTKINNKKTETQAIFDNIFQNIEYTIRELGEGDVAVNKKMKKLTQIFYDILIKLDTRKTALVDNESSLLKKYFKDQNSELLNIEELKDYFTKFQDFCFALDVKNMLNGSFNFKYK
tara:strand:+ start:198 stop:698 length:501 start_codon:yes stop_codon:yes gene_type:complete